MNNEELKKKIVEALKNTVIGYDCGHAIIAKDFYIERVFEVFADALIAAGIGDVKEAKFEADHYWRMWQGALEELERAEHRAEAAERALKNLAQFCAKGARCYLQSDEDVKERERELYDGWIKQAKKELSEEGK